MKNQLMLNDILWDGEHTGRVIALSENEFIVRSDNGEWDGGNTKPMPLTNEWIVKSKVDEICEKNSLAIDFSRKNKLKLSLMNGDRIIISYFYPMPQYVHELQHILRNFNMIEI
jgi:hypothetical protein